MDSQKELSVVATGFFIKADGENYAEALQNVGVIVEQWIETAKSLGREITLPKGKLMYA